jgi:hypothetical protein
MKKWAVILGIILIVVPWGIGSILGITFNIAVPVLAALVLGIILLIYGFVKK